jgi:Galactose-3-O-sulfotransferase
MTRSNSLSMDTAGFVQPAILILFHMPKTGGTTMGSILERCFPGDLHFNVDVGNPDSAIWIASRAKIAAKYNALPAEAKQSFRAVCYCHIPMGLHTLFDRPAKYFTIIRHPVDRVISQFFYTKIQSDSPIFEQIKDMTLDQYLDSGLGLDPFDHQVRILSGCRELDAPHAPGGKPMSAVPVEDRHLQLAKQNIEEHFLTVAPFEEFATLVVLLKRLYGWKLRKCLFDRRNVTVNRPRVKELQAATRRRIEDCNRHDMALYDWAKARFVDQIRTLKPQIVWDRLVFGVINNGWQLAVRIMPESRRTRFKNWVWYS